MIPSRVLTATGLGKFEVWLTISANGAVPQSLIDGEEDTELLEGVSVDPGRRFSSRLEFGAYLNECLASKPFPTMLSETMDGFWAWIAIVYFGQLSEKGVRRSEHYLVKRGGSAGSLAYRHGPRLSYELYRVHGGAAIICLRGPMHSFGDMAEQIASRQTIARNIGFFQIVHELYISGGSLKRGATSRPKKPAIRQKGDRTGFGGIRRLLVVLQRLDLTFDTEALDASQLIGLLPKEFDRWSVRSG